MRNFRNKKPSAAQHGVTRKITALFTALTMLLSMALPAQAAEERSLKLYFVNTKERIEIVYKRNGRYVPAALKKLNWFLRDWRREQSTTIDPRLLDLVWSVYQQMDTREAINVVSAFRSPKTNSLLRSRSSGVAKNSQHTRGKAMDFFIPGTNLAELRAVGLRMEVGGVGFYPSSGSPFVHMDTGGVRHWPRMTDAQLAKVFPRGDTTQISSNGKRQKRYEESAARQKRIASAEISPPNQRGGGLFAKVFKRNQEPATIPTTGQTLTSGNDSTTVAQVQAQTRASAPALKIVPRFRPDGVPTQLLPEPVVENSVQLALSDIPAPRPMPADVFAQRAAALADKPVPLTIVSKEPATPAETQKSVQDTWARVGDSRSTDVSEIIIAKAAGPVRAGAPDVAQAVMAALDDTRNKPALQPLDTRTLEAATPHTSAAASIAAAILSPQGRTPDPSQRSMFDDTIISAYAPSDPSPRSRADFDAAMGLDGQGTAKNSTRLPHVTTPEDLPPVRRARAFHEPVIAAIPPRIRPERTQLAAVTPAVPSPEQPARREPVNPAQSPDSSWQATASALPTTLGGRVPPGAVQPTGSQLVFNGADAAVLAKMTTPQTTRSNAFVRLELPNPYAIRGVFQIPQSIVANGFSTSSTTLRTDKFSGRAIVATKVALLTRR
uniref:DUF882 domain-containing protein n=1 Tax=Pararhizobium sp. IMCC3301 TaxID=3067904 RepID=UPI0027423D81|nr:DUF882 domain-containing protein [Pararhizobium sp. IMCC3301]